MTVLNQNKYLWTHTYTEFYFIVQYLYNPHTKIIFWITASFWTAIPVQPISIFLKLVEAANYREKTWILRSDRPGSQCLLYYIILLTLGQVTQLLGASVSSYKIKIPSLMVIVTYKVNEYIWQAQFLGYRWCSINGNRCFNECLLWIVFKVL